MTATMYVTRAGANDDAAIDKLTPGGVNLIGAEQISFEAGEVA